MLIVIPIFCVMLRKDRSLGRQMVSPFYFIFFSSAFRVQCPPLALGRLGRLSSTRRRHENQNFKAEQDYEPTKTKCKILFYLSLKNPTCYLLSFS
jgi:hypothetical protein